MDSYPGENVFGKVYAVNAEVNVQTRNLEMRATIDNKDNKLVPGTFVLVTLFAGPKKQIIEIISAFDLSTV